MRTRARYIREGLRRAKGCKSIGPFISPLDGTTSLSKLNQTQLFITNWQDTSRRDEKAGPIRPSAQGFDSLLKVKRSWGAKTAPQSTRIPTPAITCSSGGLDSDSELRRVNFRFCECSMKC